MIDTRLGRRALHGALAGLLLIQGCVYRMPIQQGNYLDAAKVAEVKPGMTRSQVRYLLGTPMVPGGFDSRRWDYDYYLNAPSIEQPVRQRTTVYFADDRVQRVETTVKPTEPMAAPAG